MSEDTPTAGAVVGAIGGFFVILAGLFLGSIGSALSSSGYYAGGNLLGLLGVYGDFIGFLVILVSIRLYTDPEHHVGYGIGLIILGFLSFPAGAGFFIGLILCVIAGILGIIWEGDEDDTFDYRRRAFDDDEDGPFYGPGSPSRSSAWPVIPAAVSPPTPPKAPLPTAASSTSAPTGSGKKCPSCGTVFEPSRSYCPQCGALAP